MDEWQMRLKTFAIHTELLNFHNPIHNSPVTRECT
jgi:hypothetical protein